MGTYSRRDYLAIADEKQVDQFYNYVNELQGLVAEKGWDLEKHFRKTWCAFKPGEYGKVAFGIGFESRDALYLYIKGVQDKVKSFPVPLSSYNEAHHQAQYLLEPKVKQLKGFMPLFELAYQRCTEK